jgi:hypothetical protein
MADPAISGGVRDAPGRLPRPRTSFVGRESELAQAGYLLGHNRLLTLTGPGGCGKTRLSIALAARVMGAFPEGVRFVPLAAISDASLDEHGLPYVQGEHHGLPAPGPATTR